MKLRVRISSRQGEEKKKKGKKKDKARLCRDRSSDDFQMSPQSSVLRHGLDSEQDDGSLQFASGWAARSCVC